MEQQNAKPLTLLHDVVKAICRSNDVVMEVTESDSGATYTTFTIPQAKMKYAIGMGGKTKNALTRIARAMCSRQNVVLTLLAKEQQPSERQHDTDEQRTRRTNNASTHTAEEDFG